MRPPWSVSSAPAGGSREQEQGEAQGGSEVLVGGRAVSGEWRVANGEWEDEELLASNRVIFRPDQDICPVSAGPTVAELRPSGSSISQGNDRSMCYPQNRPDGEQDCSGNRQIGVPRRARS
jgi:hypothetical protein